MKLLIVGGVAGGASAAARARRNSEDTEIILFEKGEYVSFANCGLPYHVGKVIREREDLLVMTPEALKKRANIEVRIKNEVISVSPSKKEITVKDLSNGKVYTESYDKLILSPGSMPFIPDIPGIKDNDVDVLWTIPDMDKIIAKIKDGARNAVVVGGGFIGIEVAENLAGLGIKTTIIEKIDQLLPPFDKEMASILEKEMISNGINLMLNTSVIKIDKDASKKFILTTDKGSCITADIVIFSIGVTPNTEFLKDSGIKLNSRGGIVVDKCLRTNVVDVFAVGDAAEVNDLILNKQTMIPLAGPANKQGRIAADNVFGAEKEYKGSLGTAICKVFNLTAACVGCNERKLKAEKVDYFKYYVVPGSNASYYPGSESMFVKIIADKSGKILGSQIVGGKSVDKRIDALAIAIRTGLALHDLEELELAYAPPYNSAKDPINIAGFVGSDILSGKSEIVNSDNIPEDAFLVDVRGPDEFEAGTIPGAVNIPLGAVRKNLSRFQKEKLIVVFCRVGLRGYIAERIFKNNGYKVKNLSGGYLVWKLYQPTTFTAVSDDYFTTKGVFKSETEENMAPNFDKEIDICGLQCPGPIVKVREALNLLSVGQVLKVIANDIGFFKDLPSWCSSTGNVLTDIKKDGNRIEALIRKTEACISQTNTSCNTVKNKKSTIVLFSNDLDKAMAAMIIATGFASLGHGVSIFCTFWGLNVLRKESPPLVKKDLLSRMFGFMMPRGAGKLALSKMHMMGMGTAMMKHVMKNKNVGTLPELMKQAQEIGVKFLACDMAMNVMGIKPEELIDGVEIAGVANFAALSEQSSTTLFI